jgi:hypothetical protein
VLRIVEELPKASEPISAAEIFEAAYDDAAGRGYWRLWLKHEQDEGPVAKLLATHFVAERAENPDASAAIAAYPPIWSWEAQVVGALRRYPTGPLTDRLKSIAEDEEFGYLVAPSARAFLVGEMSDAHARPDAKPRGKRGRPSTSGSIRHAGCTLL